MISHRSNKDHLLLQIIRTGLGFAVLLSIYHFSIILVRAQNATATLSGTVVDQNDAVITDVNISVISIAQGFQRSAVTNAQGHFVVPLLPPGTYIVKAERTGFATAEVRDVVLNVNDQVAVNIQLKIGTITGENVTVVDTSPLTNESPAVGTVVSRNFVENIPLNGRSFQSLIGLTPGVVLTATNVTDQGQFSVNGQRANANYFTVDGVSANFGANASAVPGQSGAGSLPALTAFGGTNNLVSVDALQEFRMLTSTYAPEFGRSPGAQISIVTRAGTNAFHGTLFEYFRNDVLDANDWFANRQRLKKPALRQNDFGGVLGGPIVRNRAFFFFSYEGLRLRQPQVGITSVPSLAARQAAPSDVLPFMNIYPVPNAPATGTGLAGFSSSFSNPATLNATSIRVDGNTSNKMTWFGRYNYAPSNTSPRAGTGIALSVIRVFSASTETLTGGTTYLINTNVSNDLRLNYSRSKAESFSIVDDFGGAIVPSESSLFPTGLSSSDASLAMQISSAVGSAIFFGKGSGTRQRQLNIIDNLLAITGNHQFKLGVDYRRLAPILTSPSYSQVLIFSGVGATSSPAAGTMLSGRALQARISSQKGPQIPIFNNLSLYVQDTWKTTPRLTLTYGLRWELVPPPHEAHGNDPATVNQITDPATMSLAAPGSPLWKTTYGNFAPRFGLAYQLVNQQGREVILRGGVGIFYDLGDGQATNAFASSFPFTARKVLTNRPLPLSSTDAAAPLPGPAPTSTDTFFVFDPELQLPRIYQWNAALEWSPAANQVITASYVAAVGRRLLRVEERQNVNPNLLGLLEISRNDATSDYHALQLQYQRRVSRGLQVLASYTWGKSLDTISTDALATVPADIFGQQGDRGPSSFDVRHAFNGAVIYDLPRPKFGSVANSIFSNWSIDTIVTARSTTPVNVIYFITSTTGQTGTFAIRPDLISGQPLYLDDSTVGGGRRINPAAFAIPSTLRQGTLGRNSIRGFNLAQIDFAVRRQFPIGERVKLQFKTEIFNLLNHPNFGNPSVSLGSASGGSFFPDPLFGQSLFMLGRSLGTGGTNGGFNPLYQVGGPRSMQLSLRLTF
jgi:Carboxypeptidase regulatory-like domain/TonB dependent receptor-like, beta-barrel